MQLSTSGNDVSGAFFIGKLKHASADPRPKYSSCTPTYHQQSTFAKPSSACKLACPGCDTADATSAQQPVPDFAEGLLPVHQLSSRPLEGKRIGVLQQTMGPGIDQGVNDAMEGALKHLESLGATVSEVMTSDVPLPSLAWLRLEVTHVLGNKVALVLYGMLQPILECSLQKTLDHLASQWVTASFL